MKKYTLQEESSRIKNMMGIREDLQSPMDEKSIGSVSDVIDYVTNVSEKVEIIASDMSADFEGTEFWDYIKPMYSGLRSVSDMDRMYTRSDQQSENVFNVIDRLKSDHSEESSVENDDYDERQERNYGVEDLNELGGYIGGEEPEKIDGPFIKEIDPSVYEGVSYVEAMYADILLMRLYRNDIISKNAFLEVRKPINKIIDILKGNYDEKQKDLPF